MRTYIFFLSALLLLFNGACRDFDGPAEIKRDEPWKPLPREVKYLSPTMFKMLGMLDEYISRFDYSTGRPKGTLVAGFYPAEDQLAYTFESLILGFRKRQYPGYEYTRVLGKQCHITFYSRELSNIINSFYILVDGRIATLDRSVFLHADRESKLSYLEGAYLRYGIENSNVMRMANALEKVKTIARVLKSLNCQQVRVYASEGSIPMIVAVVFQPGEIVRNRLNISMIKERDYFKEQEYYRFCEEM
ncbi:MAG: hypothetical protein GY765_07270 [bacterium]|nr:hypothetical protein [bacterium]